MVLTAIAPVAGVFCATLRVVAVTTYAIAEFTDFTDGTAETTFTAVPTVSFEVSAVRIEATGLSAGAIPPHAASARTVVTGHACLTEVVTCPWVVESAAVILICEGVVALRSTALLVVSIANSNPAARAFPTDAVLSVGTGIVAIAAVVPTCQPIYAADTGTAG